MKECYKDLDTSKVYQDLEAIKILKEKSSVKFVESLDVSINLGIDAKKSDQNIRGSLVLPNGTGKTVKVAVFCEGEDAQKATAAGADVRYGVRHARYKITCTRHTMHTTIPAHAGDAESRQRNKMPMKLLRKLMK